MNIRKSAVCGGFVVAFGIVVAALAPATWAFRSNAAAEWERVVVMTGAANATAVAADFTGDGRADVITSANGKTLLYVAPDWKEVVLDAGSGRTDCIHSAAMDVNGDGRPDFVGAVYSPGLIFWLECPEKPLEQPWPRRLVDDKV